MSLEQRLSSAGSAACHATQDLPLELPVQFTRASSAPPRDTTSLRAHVLLGPRRIVAIAMIVTVAMLLAWVGLATVRAHRPIPPVNTPNVVAPLVDTLRGHLVSAEEVRCPRRTYVSGLRAVDWRSRTDPPIGPVHERVGAYIVCLTTDADLTRFYQLVIPPGDESFKELDAALRMADQPSHTGLCPTTYVPRVTIYVRTDRGAWRLHLPLNACDGYRVPLSSWLVGAAANIEIEPAHG